MKKYKGNIKLLMRQISLLLLDAAAINIATFLALFIRFDFRISDIDPVFVKSAITYAPINTAITIGVLAIFRLYSSLWQYAGATEATYIIWSMAVCSVAQCIGMVLLRLPAPRSFYILQSAFLGCFVIISRFSYRFIRSFNHRGNQGRYKKNVMVVGAGEAGTLIINEIKSSSHLNLQVCCAIDDSNEKIGRYIHGIKVVGNREDIPRAALEYDISQIIIAMPSQGAAEIKNILEICNKTGCELKLLPGIYQLVNNEVSVSRLRKVKIEDLLGREPINVDIDKIISYVTGRTVLITGGGGSIGSEICRQVASHKPKSLIILDIYENNAYDIQQELIKKYPSLSLFTIIASVRDKDRIEDVFKEFKPDIVYHAAAHKHVPLMEDSPCEAIKNNVGGTKTVLELSVKYKVKRFVLISSDKAVNPTNVMGASKRICEMLVQVYNKRAEGEFAAVRFGNVLGSNGSVIPLFKKQIASGGPVTVTHPEIIRFFMTIPEAVSLVLQAGAFAVGGEIFVLDMGEPIKIVDLANNLIRLSGYVPDEDIKIEFTGLRPGEKLYEELLMDEEGLKETDNKLIFIGSPIEIDEEEFISRLDILIEAAEKNSRDIRSLIKRIVPTYSTHEKKNY
ncbi:polysaccharide biosynthesis protein [Alloiococcus sp. CFN-8]|uniref:polysaccharide biosynthesis protein n=1 Tax=Alloiococcus sp. CFN-8 TaxID=3416081 RepID=UPI003CE8AB46